MKKMFLFILLLCSITVFGEEIVIYGPSSAKWIGKHYGPIFKQKTGVDIKYISVSGSISRLRLESKNPKADIIVGLTSLQTSIAKKLSLIAPYKPKNTSMIKSKDYIMDKDYYCTPFDYGLLAINYDKKKLSFVPKDLSDISKMKRSLITENPTVSSTGEEMLLWSIALYDNEWKKFWQTLKPAIYAAEPGWDEAFAKFTAGEAPMMMGYATSNLFFVSDKDEQKYDSFIPKEGAFMYLEGISLINKSKMKDGAKLFMEEILGKEFQEMIPNKNYMFPVTAVKLPKGFDTIPKADKIVKLSDTQIEDLVINIDKYKKELVQILKNEK